MRTFVLSLTVAAALIVSTSPATAQVDHTASQAAIDAALAQHASQADADRAAVHGLLARPDVAALAGSMGLDLQRADRAVATLDGSELASLAAQARQADADLAGGQSSVRISTTLIIIGLLVLILIIVAVD